MQTNIVPDESKIRRINRIQSDFFSRIVHMFDPPLPEGVPERLGQIVASANIVEGNRILDVGTGTGILIPLIQAYHPGTIYSCDLSEAMLARLKEKHPDVVTIVSDARDLAIPDNGIDVVFVNACYSNIADKASTFSNISRMLKPGGRLVISHPLGKSFIGQIKEQSPFPLDDFPDKLEAQTLLRPYGFEIRKFIDRPDLYVLTAIKSCKRSQVQGSALGDRAPARRPEVQG